MFVNRPHIFVIAGALVLLQACASGPFSDESSKATEQEVISELNLNLPVQAGLACVRQDAADYTFLDKGFSALVAGEHIEAVTYFQQYQRVESSPITKWEGDIAIAYDSMLPQSPFYDPKSARKSYLGLAKQQPEGAQFHEKTLMMRDALATFTAMALQIKELESDKKILSADLEKREEAIRRLRELTLGQKGAAQ